MARSDVTGGGQVLPDIADVIVVALERGLADEPPDPGHQLGLVLGGPGRRGGFSGSTTDL